MSFTIIYSALHGIADTYLVIYYEKYLSVPQERQYDPVCSVKSKPETLGKILPSRTVFVRIKISLVRLNEVCSAP